ncbi:MAG: BBP7 family outer membrane beta-barrel protein [Gemmataceae bacterium]
MRTSFLFALALFCAAGSVLAQSPSGPESSGGPGVSSTATVAESTGGIVPSDKTAAVVSDEHPTGEVAATGSGWGHFNQPFWVSAGYTFSWFRPQSLPGPIFSQGPVGNPLSGRLSEPGTIGLFGGPIEYNAVSGVQLEAGVVLDDQKRWTLEGVGSIWFPSGERFEVNPNPRLGVGPVIARPLFNVLAGEERAFQVNDPAVAGTSTADTKAELYGYELNLRYHRGLQQLHVDGLVGYRFLRLAENLSISDRLLPGPDSGITFRGARVNPGEELFDEDHFGTSNLFHGGQVGLRVGWQDAWYLIGVHGKVALGVTGERLAVAGATTLNTPTGATTVPGGILALPSNSGSRTRSVFGVVPEGGVTFGVAVTPHIRVTGGYSFLFWNSVVRPGSQIDRNVNPVQIPTDINYGIPVGPARPRPLFEESSFWVHTLNASVEVYF